MRELWVKIKEYPKYEVSSMGNVRRADTKKILATGDSRGYKKVHLYDENIIPHNKSVHRLVAKAFLPNPYNLPEVNHIDENKANNSVENLEWCTGDYNTKYSCNKKVRCVETGEIFNSITEASKAFNVTKSSMSDAVHKNYKVKGYHFQLVEKDVAISDDKIYTNPVGKIDIFFQNKIKNLDRFARLVELADTKDLGL